MTLPLRPNGSAEIAVLDREDSSRDDVWLPSVSLLTGGGDRPYALGLAASLASNGLEFDMIGSDDLEAPEVCHNAFIRFINLRGNQDPGVPLVRKIARVIWYYARLLLYAARSHAAVFHILWNNKLEYFDRTILLLYYRLLGKKIVFTVHNVNARKRDGNDGVLNRLTLRMQYRLVDYLFVHTEEMKRELEVDFDIASAKISVVPFGINSTVPDTALTAGEARQRLGLSESDKVLLFFGNIAPYKGLEYLVEALALVQHDLADCRLVIAGRPKASIAYWTGIQQRISALGLHTRTLQRIEYVPDADTEIYFKAADVLILPYTHVFQSGVLFLSYNFGLPVIASDVGSLKADIVEGQTGFVCAPRDPAALGAAIERYFGSDLYRQGASRREAIRGFAADRNSWTKVADITTQVYSSLGVHTARRA